VVSVTDPYCRINIKIGSHGILRDIVNIWLAFVNTAMKAEDFITSREIASSSKSVQLTCRLSQ
jgi:hypothetical protein